MKNVKCPNCGEVKEYDQKSPYRPFCTERCQVLDLANWADGKHFIPQEETESIPQAQDSSEVELKQDWLH